MSSLPSTRDQALHDLARTFSAERGLSARERRVVELAAAGFHDKEMAHQMACSPSTVQEYWRRIFRKTGVDSRARVLCLLIQRLLPRAGAASRAT